jgi:hypothetical protein
VIDGRRAGVHDLAADHRPVRRVQVFERAAALQINTGTGVPFPMKLLPLHDSFAPDSMVVGEA